jgi:RNA polymerase sigma factor (sigma-70 family)
MLGWRGDGKCRPRARLTPSGRPSEELRDRRSHRRRQEARLAHQAAEGDGEVFAELYHRYERRAYNLCYRILGSEDDAADATQEAFVNVLRRLPKLRGRELAFGSCLFTSARNACYDLIERRKRAEPSDEIAESSIPVGCGVGGGGFGFDPGDPEDDPERNVLVAARQDEIRTANATLPPRQREVLALRELEDLSYDEIAEVMDMNRNSVAQLISRARISLRDALRGTALASIATSSADCERAVALLVAAQDRQRDGGRDWLDRHLDECATCHLSRDAMEEAGVSYRAWLPIAAAPRPVPRDGGLRRRGDRGGLERRDSAARRCARRRRRRRGAQTARASLLRHRRLDLALMGLLALVLVVVVFAGSDDAPPADAVSASEEVPPTRTDEAAEPKSEPTKERQRKKGAEKSPAAAPADKPRREDSSYDEQDTDAGGGKPGGRESDEPSALSAPPDKGEPARKQPDGDSGRRRQGGGSGEDAAGGEPPSVTPMPTPPPPPPPEEEPPTPPAPVMPPEPPRQPPTEPPPSTPGCRNAAGNPIPCPPRRPPPPPRVRQPPP